MPPPLDLNFVPLELPWLKVKLKVWAMHLQRLKETSKQIRMRISLLFSVIICSDMTVKTYLYQTMRVFVIEFICPSFNSWEFRMWTFSNGLKLIKSNRKLLVRVLFGPNEMWRGVISYYVYWRSCIIFVIDYFNWTDTFRTYHD